MEDLTKDGRSEQGMNEKINAEQLSSRAITLRCVTQTVTSVLLFSFRRFFFDEVPVISGFTGGYYFVEMVFLASL